MKEIIKNLSPSNLMTKANVKFYTASVNALPSLENKYNNVTKDFAGTDATQSAFLRRMQMGSGALLAAGLSSQAVAMAADCGGTAQGQVVSLIKNATKFIIILISALSVLMLAWAAFLYTTSAGNSSRASQAKESAKNVVIGFALAACIFLVRSVVIDVASSFGGGSDGIKECLENTNSIS